MFVDLDTKRAVVDGYEPPNVMLGETFVLNYGDNKNDLTQQQNSLRQ